MMYRGQDIGNRETLLRRCKNAVEEGRPEVIKQLLPHISVIREPELLDPLLELLERGDLRQKEMAAIALGTLGDPRAIQPLKRSLKAVRGQKGRACEALLIAAIAALGEIGHGDAVESLMEIYCSPNGRNLEVQRKHLVVLSLGLLAQQGSKRAEQALQSMLEAGQGQERIEAVKELSYAYWNRPNAIPEPLLQRIIHLAEESPGNLREAAMTALRDLSQLGCRRAEEYFDRERV